MTQYPSQEVKYRYKGGKIIKRRDFIINSALAIGGTTLFSGCNKKEIKKSQNQVIRKKFQNILFSGLILITLSFGRIYCSLICPFGIMQEIFALFFKKKNKQEKNYPIKYFILAITFGALITGSAFLIRYIEPYTYFSSLISLTN